MRWKKKDSPRNLRKVPFCRGSGLLTFQACDPVRGVNQKRKTKRFALFPRLPGLTNASLWRPVKLKNHPAWGKMVFLLCRGFWTKLEPSSREKKVALADFSVFLTDEAGSLSRYFPNPFIFLFHELWSTLIWNPFCPAEQGRRGGRCSGGAAAPPLAVSLFFYPPDVCVQLIILGVVNCSWIVSARIYHIAYRRSFCLIFWFRKYLQRKQLGSGQKSQKKKKTGYSGLAHPY